MKCHIVCFDWLNILTVYFGIIYAIFKFCVTFAEDTSVSVSDTCRIPKRLLYTARESAGFMGCIPVGRS